MSPETGADHRFRAIDLHLGRCGWVRREKGIAYRLTEAVLGAPNCAHSPARQDARAAAGAGQVFPRSKS